MYSVSQPSQPHHRR